MELTELTDALESTEFKAFAGARCIKGINAAGKAEEGRTSSTASPPPSSSAPRTRVAEGGGGRHARVAGGQVLSEGEQAELGKRLDAQPGDLLLIVADEWQTTCDVLGQLRNDLGRPPVHEGPYRTCGSSTSRCSSASTP